MFLYGKKVLYWKILLLKKNFFYREKYKRKCKKLYISIEKYIFMQKMFVLQIKYKYFLNFLKYVFILQKKKFWLIKNIFVKTSLRTQQSGP